jgi:hypothetical protein
MGLLIILFKKFLFYSWLIFNFLMTFKVWNKLLCELNSNTIYYNYGKKIVTVNKKLLQLTNEWVLCYIIGTS